MSLIQNRCNTGRIKKYTDAKHYNIPGREINKKKKQLIPEINFSIVCSSTLR